MMEGRMKKFGIVCAGDKEFAPFIPIIDECKITEKAMLKFYEGRIGDVEVVALFSGVCKVNAAIATQILIDTFKVDVVINAGTAGGMNHDLEIFDVAISTEVAYHDVAPHILTEFHPWMDSIYFHADKELLELAKIVISKLGMESRSFFGRMVTGEAFISEDGRDRINNEFAPLTVDMETASIAHVCYVNKTPFISIRCITDTATHSGVAHFEENCEKASAIAKDITVALLAEVKRM